jgi:hypothetical protein
MKGYRSSNKKAFKNKLTAAFKQKDLYTIVHRAPLNIYQDQ